LIQRPTISAPSAEDLGGYVNEAEQWLDRLKQAQSWLKKWEGSISSGSDTKPEVGSPSYEEWLQEQIAQSGYITQSFAPIEDSFWPVVAKKMSMESLRIAAFGDKDLTLSAENLASNPKQLALSPRLEMTSKDESLSVLLQLDELSGAGTNRLSISADGLDAESTLSALKPSISKQISGGQIALNVDGNFRYAGDGELNLELLAALENSELTVRRRNIPVETLEVPVQIRGSFNAPKIRVENKAIEDQLKNLAEGALKDEAKSRVEDKVKDKLGDLFKRRIR
jgi:DNA-binding protein YbaB